MATRKKTTSRTRKHSKQTTAKRNRSSTRVSRNLWHEAITYIKESKQYIQFVVLLFIISSIIGYAFPSQFTFFNELLAGLSDSIEGLGLVGLMWFIFQNNITSAFLGLILGAFLGIMPIFNALTNGVLLGYVYALASAQNGFGVIWYLVPHGIFELPAIFISLGLGIKLGTFVFSEKGTRLAELKRRFWHSLSVFLAIILPLLFIAAIIEGALIFFS